MFSHYLLDTNIASYIIRQQPAAVYERLKRESRSRVAISVITEGELVFGIARRPDGRRLNSLVHDFLERVEVLPWDSAAAHQYGHLRAYLENKGLPIGNLDLLLASYALAHDMVLVSNDRAFQRVPNLRLEDWTKA